MTDSPTEAAVTTAVLKRLATTACRVFRNNIGFGWTGQKVAEKNDRVGGQIVHLMTLKNPQPLRAGLVKGASDYIGWTSVVVTPDMVGKTVAVFTALEMKASAKAPRTPEQVHFIDTVKAAGGKAGFVASVEDAEAVIK